MKKNRCYPKYSYIVSFILAFVLFVFAIGPIFIKTKDELYIKIIFSVGMFILSVFSTVGALIMMQYYVIESDKIIVKSIFGEIVSLEISDCTMTIQKLPTFSNWQGVVYEQWLCIYSKTNHTPLFKKGCSNKRKHKRIQVIYSKQNSKILSQYIESSIQQALIN